MSSDQQPPPKPRRSRKSIAVMPTSSVAQISKENSSSTELTAAKPTRKSRSKSLGPGGLDALNGESNGRGLKDANGNGRRVSSVCDYKFPLLCICNGLTGSLLFRNLDRTAGPSKVYSKAYITAFANPGDPRA